MRKCNRPESGIADRSGVDVTDRFMSEVDGELGGHLHEEIVRMLPVDKSLADLKELRVTALSDGQWLEAEHRAQHQMSTRQRPLGHSHDPVRREELIAPARPALHDLAD